MTREPAPRGASLPPLAAAALVSLAAALPYLPTLDNYYVRDDFGVVHLLSQKPWHYFPRWFTTSWMDSIWGFTPDEIRPFPALSYQLTAWIGAGSPVPDHVVNIGLHAVNALLVLVLASKVVGLGMLPATYAAVSFALLPNQAETVAWITGRVDSMPAFFYLASLLAYVRWRESAPGRWPWYAASVLLCFAGLFTKQTVVTLVVSIALYEVLVTGTALRTPWRAAGPLLPFALLTAGYLWLRYALFGEVAREGHLSQSTVELFVARAHDHFERVVFGSEFLSGAWRWWLLAGALAVTIAAAARAPRDERRGALRQAIYFGPAWWGIGVAPVLVAGYVSSRHVYLASVAWALMLGLSLQLILGAWRGRAARVATALTAVLLLSLYAAQTRAEVGEWDRLADLSARAVDALEQRAAGLEDGALVVVDVPWQSWEWGLPFAGQPPFTRTDLTSRLFVIWPRGIDCCKGTHWSERMEKIVQAWGAQEGRPPVLAMHWDLETAALSTLSDAEEPALHDFARLLLSPQSSDELDRTITAITSRLVPHPTEAR